jgi:2-alkenal reductase
MNRKPPERALAVKHIARTLLAALIAVALTACSFGNLPVPNPQGEPPTAVPATPEPRPTSPPREAQPTSGPLPTIEAVPTIAATFTTALEEEERLLVELYRRINPAVVSIEVLGSHPDTGNSAEPETIPYGQGSGFLFDDQGHIITNNHVVESGDAFQVRFSDGSIFEARLVGTDAGSDLAVLKVDELPDGAAPLAIANSSEVEVGQTAIAIGNPFGLQNTLTVGVVSGVGRSLAGPASGGGGRFRIPNVIQTDAAINPGNSGGPLLNVRGEVIGVNTAIRTESGTFEGIAYAVPANAVARVVPALISAGHYAHPWMGVGMQDITPLLAKALSLPVSQGVLVTEVQFDSPAEKAGLLAGTRAQEVNGVQIPANGDIVTAVDGTKVLSVDDLVSYLELNTSAGDVIELAVLRDGKETMVQLTLGSRPDE